MKIIKQWKEILFVSCLLGTAYLCTGCTQDDDVVVYETDAAGVLAAQTNPEKEAYTDRKQTVDEGRDSSGRAEEMSVTEKTSVTEESSVTEDAADESMQEDTIYVQVCGSVNNPGVYELNAGDRIFQAIDLAGGLTGDANGQSVNQACEAEDGQMIYVYSNEEWHEVCEGNILGMPDFHAGETAGGNDTVQSGDGKIDINRADAVTLTDLAGIGEKLAERIVAYRDSNGKFQDIEDIKKVSGIGDSLFEKIKDRIKV